MKKLVIILIILGLLLSAAWLAPALIRNPGVVEIEFLGYQFTTPLIVALVGGLAVFIGIWLIWFLIKLPGRTAKKVSHGRSRKKFANGLLALSEGKWAYAEKLLTQSAKKSATPELSYMAAARAAMAQNNLSQAEDYLNQAEQVIDNPLTVDLSRCELWIKADQSEKAMPVLEKILKTYPNNPRAIRLLTEAAQNNHQWAQLRRVLPKAQKLKLIDQNRKNLLISRSWSEQMNAIQSPEELMQLWHAMDHSQQTELLFDFCDNALRVGAHQELTEIIEKKQKSSYSDALVEYWSRLPYNLNHRIKICNKWLTQHPDSAALHSCLGQLHLQKKNWQEAEDYLNKALILQPSVSIHQMLGNLYSENNETEKALSHYQQAAKTGQSLTAIKPLEPTN